MSEDNRPRAFSVREEFTSEAVATLAGKTFLRDQVFKEQGAPAALTGAATLTTAQMLGGLITLTQSTGATVAITTPTGAVIESDLDRAGLAMEVNDSFDFTIINLSSASADTGTLTAGASGVTLVGAVIIPSSHSTTIVNSSKTYRVRKTAANTYSIYALS